MAIDMGILNAHSKHSYDTVGLEKLVASAKAQARQSVRQTWSAPPKKSRRLTTTEITDLVAQYNSGATTYQVAKDFGITRDTLRKHLRKNSVPMRRRGLSPDQVKAAADLYEQGFSSNAIAKEFGVSPTTVLRKLREQGMSKD